MQLTALLTAHKQTIVIFHLSIDASPSLLLQIQANGITTIDYMRTVHHAPFH